jgi:ribose transport system permease protein
MNTPTTVDASTPAPATDVSPNRPARSGGFLGAIRRFHSLGPLTSLIVLVVLLSFLSPYFFAVNNLFNVFQQITVLAVVALGGTAVIISGGIDLSVGSVAALAGTTTAVLFSQHNVPMVAAIIIALAVGAVAGLANGSLIVFAKVPPFIATLAMLSVARGLTLVFSNGQPLSGFPDWFTTLTVGQLFGFLPAVVLLVVVLYVVGGLFLRFRPTGREVYAIGGNEEVARLSGVRVGFLKLRLYTVAGVLAALGGLVLTSQLASAQPTAADGLELDVIAAIVIGGASLSGGVGSVVGTLIGTLIIGVLRNGLNLLNVSAFWQQVVIGVVIAAAVMTDTLGRRRKRRR